MLYYQPLIRYMVSSLIKQLIKISYCQLRLDNCDIIGTESAARVARTLTTVALSRAAVCEANGGAVLVKTVTGCVLCPSAALPFRRFTFAGT